MIRKAITAVAGDQHRPRVLGYAKYNDEAELDLLTTRMLRFCDTHGLDFRGLYNDRDVPRPGDEWSLQGFGVLLVHLTYMNTKRVLVLDVDQLSRVQLDAVVKVGADVYVLSASKTSATAPTTSPVSANDLRDFEADLRTIQSKAGRLSLEGAAPGQPAACDVPSTASTSAPSIGCFGEAVGPGSPEFPDPPSDRMFNSKRLDGGHEG